MLAGRHVIITGATTGIGKELVKKFAKTGAKITVGHNMGQSGALDRATDFVKQLSSESNNENIALKYIDVSNFDCVRQFACDIEDCHVLINNAGIMSSEQKKQSGMELTMRTNFLGPFLLTNLLMPAMMHSSEKDSIECRVVNLTSTSEAKAEAFPGRDPLGQSAIRGDLPDSVTDTRNKSSRVHFYGMLNSLDWVSNGPVPYFMLTAYANASLCTILATTVELSQRLMGLKTLRQQRGGQSSTENNEERKGGDFNITVNSVCPGYVNTDLWKESSMLWTPFRYMIFKSPEKGSEIVFDIATSKEYDSVTGQFFSSMAENVSSDMSKSQELAKLVWEKSCKLVNIKDTCYGEDKK